jgi:hypothetical protein
MGIWRKKKLTRIGDAAELRNLLENAVERALRFVASDTRVFQCDNCLDRGFVLIDLEANGIKYQYAAHCSAMTMVEGSLATRRCSAADVVCFRTRTAVAGFDGQGGPQTPVATTNAALGRPQPKVKVNPKATKTGGVARQVTMRDLLPSESTVRGYQSDLESLFVAKSADRAVKAVTIEPGTGSAVIEILEEMTGASAQDRAKMILDIARQGRVQEDL